MRKKQNIFKIFILGLLISSLSSKAAEGFQYVSMEMGHNSSQSLEKFNTTYHFGIGFGRLFERGTIEFNPLIIIDDNELTSFYGATSEYQLSGYMLGLEYNQIINPLMTFGGGFYYERVSESYAALDTGITIQEFKTNSFFGSFQLKIFLPMVRPYVRIQLGSSIHSYSLIFGANFINF